MKVISAKSPTEIPTKWRPHYRALMRLREVLIAERAEREAALRIPRERGGTDAGDTATNESESGEIFAELEVERTELTEVEAALARIRSGTYGRCEVTGRPITAARLKAIPWTRLSSAAAKNREQINASTKRAKRK